MNEKFDAPKQEESEEELKYRNILQGNSWEIPDDTLVISPAADELSNRLTKLNWDDDTKTNVEIGFRECLANAIKYGQKDITVELNLSEDDIEIIVSDGGAGLDATAVPNPRDPENLLKTHGRGIFYMKQFFDSVTFEDKDPGTKKRGTKVTLLKRKEPKEKI